MRLGRSRPSSWAAGVDRRWPARPGAGLGIEKMPKGIIRSSYFAPWQEAAGLSPAPASLALRAQRLLIETGLTVDHLATVVVKNHRHGVANPDAMFRKAVTAEEVLAARLICPPLTLFMLCSPNEGGAGTVVLTRGGEGVRVAGILFRSHLPGSVLGEDSPVRNRRQLPHPADGTGRPRRLHAAAGIGPDDVDVVEYCQDTRTAAHELLTWTELDLCAPGEQSAVSAGGEASVGSDRSIPREACCPRASRWERRPWARWSNWSSLRGTAGGRQVDGARVGLAHVIGRGANACVTVLVS